MKAFGRKMTFLSTALCLAASGTALADQDRTYMTQYGNVIESDSINAVDMEAIQKNILSITQLDDDALDRADADRNGAVNVFDMEAVQKDILGIENIENFEVTRTEDFVSVHDPSIIQDKDGTYYIFGSHMAWAKSTDLCNWKTFTNNINTNFRTLFASEFAWAKMGDTVYNPAGNLWAPDVVWNENLGKWCMYMSINGCSWNSCICMLTADKLDGNWTYVGPVVYSGFTTAANHHDYTKTDYQKATGDSSLPSRYARNAYTCMDGNTKTSTTTWNEGYGAHAIDPCVWTEEDGTMYMSYGSWSGGIYLLELDEKTGLRDYNVKYAYNKGTSDPYMGYTLAGGNWASGEASYIQKIGNYYYMFLSYGGLTSTGGYNMRIFRADNIKGPYVDELGNDARQYKTAGAGDTNGTVGVRLMSYYKWNNMDLAQLAQGHNSAFIDSTNGKYFVVYHTRTNDGSEGHYVKTHQLFMNEDNWLVAAPYRYCGETLKETGYTTEQVAGGYDVLVQEPWVDSGAKQYVTPVTVMLNEDGTVTGAYEGTWELTKNSPYITITADGVTYKGVVVRQVIEGTDDVTMCFSMLGRENQVEVWGSKHLQGIKGLNDAMKTFNLVPWVTGDASLPTTAANETSITWSSGNTELISNDGKVTYPQENTVVPVTATFHNAGIVKKQEYQVTVISDPKKQTSAYVLGKYLTGETLDLSGIEDGSHGIISPFYLAAKNGIDISNGVSIQFDVKVTGGKDRLDTIWGFNSPDGGKLYFTAGSYLGYNDNEGSYYDANMRDWTQQKDFIGNKATVKIDFLPAGYQVSVNGTVAYTNSTVDKGMTAGTNSISNYGGVLDWLATEADILYLGSGSWWKQPFNGTVSNIVFYANPVK